MLYILALYECTRLNCYNNFCLSYFFVAKPTIKKSVLSNLSFCCPTSHPVTSICFRAWKTFGRKRGMAKLSFNGIACYDSGLRLSWIYKKDITALILPGMQYPYIEK